MDKKSYLEKLSKLVRWRLPPTEAEDVISDYAELVSNHPEDGAVLVKILGNPSLAVKLLGATKEYICWITVFVILCLNLCYFVFSLVFGACSTYAINRISMLDRTLFYLSVGLISFWKWKSPKRKDQTCPGLLPAMLGMLIPAAALITVLGTMCFLLVNPSISAGWFGSVSAAILSLSGSVSFIAVLAGLINSRIRDCRWFAVCIMAFTVLFLCMLSMSLIRSLDNGASAFRVIQTFIPPAVIGTAGVIWSLC